MTSMLDTIIAKSDQLNSDDLIGGRTMTIRVTKVDIKMDEQPVAIHFDGDGGKPYKPGKSMRRVLVNVWGPDANNYVGRSMTLYRDDAVKFGGMEVGGIRISHMSHIDRPVTMALTATKAHKRPFTVKPLETQKTVTQDPPKRTVSQWLAGLDAELTEASADPTAVDAIIARQDVQDALAKLPNGALTKLVTLIQTYNPAWNPPAVENAPENAP